MIQKEYEDLLIVQYSGKPKASATVSEIVRRFKNNSDAMAQFEEAFDLDSAVGAQLDIIGKIVGISRNIEGVIPKTFFGFDDNVNARGFSLAPFYTLDQQKYTDTQLSDSDYRFFIRIKIAKNHAKATMADDNGSNLNEVILSMFDGYAYMVDNKDMTVTIYIENSPKSYLLPYAITLDLIPLPQAVDVKYISITAREPFGFLNNPNSLGFGQGSFTRILQGA